MRGAAGGRAEPDADQPLEHLPPIEDAPVDGRPRSLAHRIRSVVRLEGGKARANSSLRDSARPAIVRRRMDLYEELEWRGMMSEATEGLRDALAAGRVTAYIGFDPTADSLHVGSLLTMMGLARLQRSGHSPIAIVGGGTGMIGDPKPNQERPLLSREDIERNVAGIRPQLARLLDFDSTTNPARIVNNADWLASFDLLGFLRDTGKYFTVNYLLQKEAVSRRLESEEGISFTEFSYPLLQARDYLELFDRFNCTLQMGGSDQWGNITAGIELVRKLRGTQGSRPGLAADDDRGGHEVRQDRGGHGVAGSAADLAVPLLPVLAEHRRSRRRSAT